tara:strand:- start:515 stop:1222 length:708 start_codon:yes stop_codon:yes gene_type:complete
MNEFNLKKRNVRRKAYFDKNNLLTKNGSDLIKNKLKYISKKIDKCLILDQDLNIDMSNFIDTKIMDINDLSLVEENFDAVISNFSLQIPLFSNSNEVLNSVLSKLNDNSVFCFNTITINSMKTLQNIFLEIDEKIYGGAYRRFGPFLETSKLIEDLNKNKYKDVVVGVDSIEVNYSSLGKIRSDFRKFGISNFFNEKQRFKKDFLKLTNELFSKLVDKHKYIPLEIEIATFTSWK